MSINILPNKISTLDCRQVAITNILSYKKYPELKTIWKDLFLRYDKEKSSDRLGGLCTNRFSTKQELQWIHGIDEITINGENESEFVKGIINKLLINEPIIVYVDIFFLKYHTAYQNRHAFHVITITDFKNDKFICVDHYQHFKGEITIEDLVLASKNTDKDFHYSYIDLTNAKSELTKEDYSEVIEFVYSVFKKDRESSEDGNIYYGSEAISEYIENCKNLKNNTIDFNDFLTRLSEDSGNISLRYNQFFEFLNESTRYFPELNSHCFKINELAQEWRIIGNMALKGQVNDSEKMYHRVIRKLQDIYELNEEFMNYTFK